MISALATLLLLAAASGADASGAPSFERVGREGGPPSEVITAVFRDRAGFLWLGARDGLMRYDGYGFSRFRHDPSDPASLSDNSIRTIFEDGKGRLWIGTNAGGLNRLDRATGRFQVYRHDAADPASLSNDSVYAIEQDPDGSLWIGTQSGLNRFDPETGRSVRLAAGAGGLPGDYVLALRVDRKGRLWVGAQGAGLALVDRKTRQVRARFHHDAKDPRSLESDTVFALFEDRAGRLCVGTNLGLDVADGADAEAGFRHVVAPSGPYSVFSLAEGPDGSVWVGTMGSGVYQVDPEAAQVILTLRHDRQRGASLADDRVMQLVSDGEGTLWVGMWGGGLQRLTSGARFVASKQGELALPSDLVDAADVTALASDASGGLYVGTRTGVVLWRAPDRPGYKRFHITDGDMLLRLLPTRDGRLLVGSAEGLLRLDPATGRSQLFTHVASDPRSLGPGYVTSLLEDREGRVWVGTGEGGLQRLAPDGSVAERYLSDAGDAHTLSENYVTTLGEDRAGRIWVGTRSAGLNAVDPGTRRVERYRPKLNNELVTSLLEDRKGRLWVGGGAGLECVEQDAGGSERITRFTTADGLADDNVTGILEDDDGSLWLSTKGGLSRFDPEGRTFTSLFASDGLPSVEFEPGSAARTRDRLYFGSVRWAVALPAGTPFVKPAASATVVAALRTLGDEAGPERTTSAPADELQVPYGRWLSMELAVLDYGADEKRAYAYRLKPDAPWIELGARRSITFTSLAPGRYELTARGRNAQGVWSELAAPVRVDVVPPFWMTRLFRAAIALALVGGVLLVHAARTASLRRRNRQLVELHDRLRLLAQRLEAAEEEERKRIARELHDDLGPSLTAVIINLQLLEAGDKAQAARRIADSSDLVDRMIQRVRDLSLDLRPPLLDEMGLLPALTGYLETQAERTGLRIDVAGAPLARLAPELEIAAFRIAQEAVTNVIRHAAARRALVSVARVNGRLSITVEDDGKGFDPLALKNAGLGSALGLLGMEERARTHGGTLAIDSAEGRGTRVTVSLPVAERP